jgi:hypothetical protein
MKRGFLDESEIILIMQIYSEVESFFYFHIRNMCRGYLNFKNCQQGFSCHHL